MAVELRRTGDRIELGATTALFKTKLVGPGLNKAGYEVSPDGQRFLMNTTADESAQPLSIIQNWPATLTKQP